MKNIVTPFEIASKDYASLLSEIRKRPGMWLGFQSLIALRALLHGIILGEDIHQIPESEKLSGFDWEAFEAWVDKQYNTNRLSVNSFYHAEKMSNSDEEAFTKWFEIYDEFIKTQDSKLS